LRLLPGQPPTSSRFIKASKSMIEQRSLAW
jgi:hypothetical protein